MRLIGVLVFAPLALGSAQAPAKGVRAKPAQSTKSGPAGKGRKPGTAKAAVPARAGIKPAAKAKVSSHKASSAPRGKGLAVTPRRPISSRSTSSAAPRESRESTEVITARIHTALQNPDHGIEFPEALAPFFQALSSSQTGEGVPVVRIMQFGDSHTAADIFTAALRTQFQAQFGDGGAGFIVPGNPFAGYRIIGTHHSMSAGWAVLGTHPRELGDAMVGMGGLSMETEGAGEWISLDASASTLTVQYLLQPDGGSIEIEDGDTLLQSISTAAPNYAAGTYTTAVPQGPHHFEVRTLERAPVRLLGLAVENSSGVTYEAMGINGVEAGLFLHWNEVIQTEEMAARQPSLIVLAYGTNEASDSNWTGPGYAAMFRSLIARCRRLAPAAAILVVGPPDRAVRVGRKAWREFDGVDRIIAAQRAVCSEMHCAFWDQRKKMGGFGAMRDWTAAGLAQADHTHLTSEGYHAMADALFADIVQQYKAFQSPSSANNGSTK